LVDEIGHPYITLYVNHVSSHLNARKAPHAIVLNFPTECQQGNNVSGATSAAEAFLEIKTFPACKNRYDHNSVDLWPVD